MNDTAIGVQVSVRIDYWSRCERWSGSRNASAGAATRITSSSVTARLALENLSEQTARTLLGSDSAVTTSSTAARIVSSDFSAAGRTVAEKTVSATAGDFSAAARTGSATTSDFSAAARSSSFATAARSCLRSVLSSQASVHVRSSVVDASHLLNVGCMKFALQAFETVQNWSAADVCWSASSSFYAAAWSDDSAVVACTRIASTGDFGTAARSTLVAEKTATGLTSANTCTIIASWSSDFSTAAWAACTASHFGSAARINNRGIAAGALGSDAVTTQEAMDQVTTEALSAKACTQNHRTNNNVPLHLD